MKNKYHILNESPKVSDRELEGYMDFDALVEKSAASSGSSKSDSRKYWRLGILIACLIGTGIWIWSNQKSNLPITTEVFTDKRNNENFEPIENNTPQNITPPPIVTNSANDIEPATTTQTTNQILTKKSQSKPEVEASINAFPKTTAPKVETKPEQSITSKVPQNNDRQTKKRNSVRSETSSPVKETRSTLEKEEYIFVDAQPKGGTKALYKFINETLAYPAEVVDKQIEGEVLIGFIIAKDGRPKNVKVEKSLGEHFDKEAIRVIQGMPDWTPALLNGMKMESKISIPLFFNPKTNN